MKTCSFIITICCLCILFVFPRVVHAKIWINEFYSNGSSDWVELYNDSEESVALDTMRLRDGSSTNKINLSGQMDPEGYAVFEWDDKLNNGGDTIKLVLASDENTILDQVIYGSSGEVFAPASGQAAGRQTNAGPMWVLFSSASRGSSNADVSPLPTVTSVPEKTPTPVKQPTPTKTPTPIKSSPTPKKVPTPTKTISGKSAASSGSESDDTESGRKSNTIKAKVAQLVNPKVPKISGIPTSILGMSSKSATPKPSPRTSIYPDKKVLVKNAVTSPTIAMTAGAVFILACGILMFLQKRRKKQE